VQRLRILGEQRQIGAAPAHGLKQIEETCHRAAAPRGRLQRAGSFESALRNDVEALPATLGEPRVARRLPKRAQSRE
jgi:hypothetical protein